MGLGRGVGEARRRGRRTLASFMIRGELGLPAAAALECWHPPRHRQIRLCSPARSLCEPVVHRRGRKEEGSKVSRRSLWLARVGSAAAARALSCCCEVCRTTEHQTVRASVHLGESNAQCDARVSHSHRQPKPVVRCQHNVKNAWDHQQFSREFKLMFLRPTQQRGCIHKQQLKV